MLNLKKSVDARTLFLCADEGNKKSTGKSDGF